MTARLLFVLAFSICIAQTAKSQQFHPTDAGSSVKFKIKNFGINTEGSFSGLNGVIVFDPQDLSGASFQVTVKSGSVNTDNTMRDNHLKKPDYFDVEGHPTISFVSSGIKAIGKEGYVMTGKLTIKETTNEISFPFSAVKQEDGWLFKGEFTINRKDYKVGGSSTIGNSLTVMLSVLAKKE